MASWLRNWCPKGEAYRDAPDAILAIDLAVTNDPDAADLILRSAWTATTILTADTTGVPDPYWYSTLARFHRLKPAAILRVKDAVEMRMRAVERRALAEGLIPLNIEAIAEAYSVEEPA